MFAKIDEMEDVADMFKDLHSKEVTVKSLSDTADEEGVRRATRAVMTGRKFYVTKRVDFPRDKSSVVVSSILDNSSHLYR